MATPGYKVYKVLAPNGELVKVEGPEDATYDELAAYVARTWKPSYSVPTEMAGSVVEPLVRIATGTVGKVAGDIAGGSVALRGFLTRNPNLDPAGAKELVQNAITYQPRTNSSRSKYNPINAAVDAFGNALAFAGEKTAGMLTDDPNSWQAAGINEAVQQGLGFVSPVAIGKVVKRPLGAAVDLASGNTAKLTARKIMLGTLGDTADAVKSRLRDAPPGLTPGQAAAGVAPAEFQVLQQRSAAYAPGASDFFQNLSKSQQASRDARLGKIAGGATREASMSAQKVAKENLRTRLDPLRQEGITQANTNTRTIEGLREEISSAREAALKATDNVRKMEGFVDKLDPSNPSVANMGGTFTPEYGPSNFGQGGQVARVRRLRWRANEASQAAADQSVQSGAAARAAEGKLAQIEAQGISALNVNPLLEAIDQRLKSPGDRTKPIQQRTLQAFKEHLSKFTDSNGNIDAYDLHGLRQNLNDIAGDLLKDADQATKIRAGAVLKSLKPVIDDGLKAAGGEKLIEYFDKYRKGVRQIQRMEFASQAKSMSPEKFVELMRGDNPAAVEGVFGPGRFAIDEQLGATTSKRMKSVAKELERDAMIKEQVTPSATEAYGKILDDNSSIFRVPNLFNPTITATNTALSKIESSLSAKSKAVLANALRGAPDTLELLNTLPAAERVAVLRALSSIKSMGPTGTILSNTGMLTPQEPE